MSASTEISNFSTLSSLSSSSNSMDIAAVENSPKMPQWKHGDRIACRHESGCSNAAPKTRKPQYCNLHYKRRNSELAEAAKYRARRLSFIDLTKEYETRREQIAADFDLAIQLASPKKTRSKEIDLKEIAREQASEFHELIDEKTAKLNTSFRVKVHQFNSKKRRIEAFEKDMERLQEKKRKVQTIYQRMKEMDEMFAPLNEIISHKKKRRNYISHQDLYGSQFFCILFNDFIDKGLCTQKDVADYFFIPPSTISSKYNLWLQFTRPGAENCPGTIDRRGSPPKLTKEHDKKIKEILVERITSHNPTQNKHLPSIVSSVNPLVSSLSIGSTARLKQRLKIASRSTPVVQKRANPNQSTKKQKEKLEEEETDISHFLDDVREALNKYGAVNVYNMDEKPLSGAPSSVSSFQLMGQPKEKIHSVGSPNRILTAAVTVSAAGNKMPVLFLKKGKSKTCKSYKSIRNNVTLFFNEFDLTAKGWMNEKSMMQYLRLFAANVPHRPCALIVDHYGSHHTDDVRELAAQLKIELILVPKKWTGSLQPLDVGVFGSLQSMTDADWETDDTAIDYMNKFQNAFQQLAPAIIRSAFCDAFGMEKKELQQVTKASEAASAMNSIAASLQYAFSDLQQAAL